jgi:biopolymer transport protein ExbD
MKHLLEVCLVALTLATSVTPSASAQSAAMQRGVSVQLAVTNNATPMPEADNEDAWIVAVTAEGAIYFGTDPVAAASLADEMKRRPRKREQKLYVKADARAPFANVESVLEIGRTSLFESAVLLTTQAERPTPGAIVAPKGLEVWLSPSSNQGSIVVQVLNSGHASPILKVNNQDVAPAALQSALRQVLQNQREKVVVVKADGQVPFGHVVNGIDVCRSTGAKVVLPTAQL